LSAASSFDLAIENQSGRRAIARLTFLLLFVSRQKVKNINQNDKATALKNCARDGSGYPFYPEG